MLVVQQVIEVIMEPRLMFFGVTLVALCAAALVVGNRSGRTNP